MDDDHTTYHNINKLFEYIRNHEWDKFIKLIDSDDTLDLNVKDLQGNHLLSYAVRFNKLDLVDRLLKKGVKYDIVDRMERSILYDAIESNFVDIIKRILDFSGKEIGVMITDIRDINGNIPLHYAIKFKNVSVVKLMIDGKSNPYAFDIDGYNALHLAVRSGSIDIVRLIARSMSNFNQMTNKGETALHIAINYQYNHIVTYLIMEGADPNQVNRDNEFSPLHYAVGWNNLEIVELLLKKGADPNQQDIYGNTPLMYCIKEDYYHCFEIIMRYPVNLNLWNIDGKIILHEVLENYNETKKNYVDRLIEGSNFLIQDSYGNTCLHYLVSLNIWTNYIELMKRKKMNIFLKNSSGISVVDLINQNNNKKTNDQNIFLDILVAGYINILKREKKNWSFELDKICSREIGELTEKEKKYIAEHIKNKKDLDDGCSLLIRNKLIGLIKKYKENKLSSCQRSYPAETDQCVEVKEDPILHICTFTGSILDVLMGLIFLIKKHSNACTTLGKNHTPNQELCDFYRSSGLIMNGRCEFINFEIVWINYKLYMIENFFELFSDCIKSKARFIIIPIGIEMKSGSHANYLIYDKTIKEVERFEPHGGTTPIGFNYNSQLLDGILADYFKSIDSTIKYIKPNDFIPKIGFQLMDTQEENRRKIGDPGGFCALWSIWYVDQRLTYQTYSREKLIKSLFYNIKSQGISYRNMIRNYSNNIIKERDELLKKINIDINDWLNDNYTNNQLDKFISLLITEISNCCVAKK